MKRSIIPTIIAAALILTAIAGASRALGATYYISALGSDTTPPKIERTLYYIADFDMGQPTIIIAQADPPANDQVTQKIIDLVTRYPKLAALLAILGSLRLLLKPAVSMARSYVASTATTKDDELLDKVEHSKAWATFTWVLDWLTSIKIGPQAK